MDENLQKICKLNRENQYPKFLSVRANAEIFVINKVTVCQILYESLNT